MKKVNTVEEYLAGVPEPQRSTLEKLRAMIRAAAPKEATEGISYGMPAFKYKGGLVAYASFKCHCSFFPMNLLTGQSLPVLSSTFPIPASAQSGYS